MAVSAFLVLMMGKGHNNPDALHSRWNSMGLVSCKRYGTMPQTYLAACRKG
jgi:hypothetical protein